MINDMERSTIRVKLEEIYDLADKRLSDAKENMIMQEIEILQLSSSFILGKLTTLKKMVIKGMKFDTPLVYRVLQLFPIDDNKLPDACSRCSDGYIGCEGGYIYACSCDRGNLRHRTEKIAYYNNQKKLSVNMRIQRDTYDLTEKENKIYVYIKKNGTGEAIARLAEITSDTF